jgi:chromosome segregation ATPase
MEHEELGVDLRATQRKLREHIQALKTITEPKLYDIVENGGICKDPAKFLQLRLERDHLAARLDRIQKRLDHALSERNQYQTKLQACENKFESVQCSLEKALQNNADLNNKLSELEQHKTIVGLRALERDDARTLLTQAERLNGKLWDDIISLSEEMWKAKEAKETDLQELRRKAETATATANEERQEKEIVDRKLTVMKQRYSDKLSASETERRQLKERVDTLEEQLSELKAKLDDTCRQLAEAQKELAGNSDTERNLARQVGCLRVELDTLEVKYSTALDEKKIAEEKAMTAEQELSRVRRMVVSDDEDREQSTIDDLKKRIKDLEEVNKHLEELQVLREETSN